MSGCRAGYECTVDKPLNTPGDCEASPTFGGEEGAPGALRLLRQVGPEDGGGQDEAGGLLVRRDADLVLGDGRVELPQEGVREVRSAVDAPVVADELLAGHLLLHLHTPDVASCLGIVQDPCKHSAVSPN